MILSVSIENWMSFRDRVTFSMIATRERRHNHRISKIPKIRTRVLPIASIYGGNASGKSNFFKALNFVRKFVVEGRRLGRSLQVHPFQLDQNCEKTPTQFEFEILAEEKVYVFNFSVISNQVVDETLVEVGSKNERVIYDRTGRTINTSEAEDKEFFSMLLEKQERNRLFLTKAYSYKLDKVRPIYNWFANSLDLVAYESRFVPNHRFFHNTHPMSSTINVMLRQLDTGIDSLRSEEASVDILPLSQEQKESGTKKLVTFHTSAEGTQKKFEVFQESEGSRRAINLLPNLIELSSESKKVFVIDDFDRSLHTLLTRKLIESFLNNCSTNSRSQLLIATHDAMLIDQSLLRRDEMWLTERRADAGSDLYSIGDFEEAKKDKDIRASYLVGRMGGIPQIFLNDDLQYYDGEMKPD